MGSKRSIRLSDDQSTQKIVYLTPIKHKDHALKLSNYVEPPLIYILTKFQVTGLQIKAK